MVLSYLMLEGGPGRSDGRRPSHEMGGTPCDNGGAVVERGHPKRNKILGGWPSGRRVPVAHDRRASKRPETTSWLTPSVFWSPLFGGVAEWFKAAVLKTAVGESSPGVRIPPPPFFFLPSAPRSAGDVRVGAIHVNFPQRNRGHRVGGVPPKRRRPQGIVEMVVHHVGGGPA